MIVELFQVASSSVVETTYLGIVFIRTANSPSTSSILGHAAAKPSYVSRPSSSMSLASSSADLYAARSSLKYGIDQTPGSSTTPSREMYSDHMILRTSTSVMSLV